MAKAKNPFMYGRLEHEHGTLLYMPDDICDWVSRKPQLFEGVRGSGKSAILRSLTWEVAWGVSDIRIKTTESKKVKEVIDNPSHIGVLWRVETMDLKAWNDWKNIYGCDQAQLCLGTYVDFYYLDLFLKALCEIQKLTDGLLSDSNAEKFLVQDLLQKCFIPKFCPRLAEPSFRFLRSAVAETHSGIRWLMFRGEPGYKILETYSTTGPGEVIQAFGEAFVKHYPDLSDWTLMPLMDDCNQLKVWQVVVINTAVARASKPIAYKLTSLKGLYPSRETLSSVRTIVEHDIETIHVPSISPKDKAFQKLAEGICRAKIEQEYDASIAKRFDLKRILGSFDIQALLEDKLKASEQEQAYDLLAKTRDRSKGQRRISITDAWLLQKEVRKLVPKEYIDPHVAKLFERRIASKYFKKWKYAAAIAMCKELGLDFPYSGWKVVLHLSSGSIRELIRIMSMIWKVARLEIDNFLEQSPIKVNIQTRAIKMSAEEMYQGIAKKQFFHHTTLRDICDRLGELFSKCQSFPYVLTAPETAAVRFKRSELPNESSNDILEVIHIAMLAGVMLKEDKNDTLSLALHTVLSPKYKICHRSPFYYPEAFSGREVADLFTSASAARLTQEVLARRLRRYYSRHKPAQQLGIFDKDTGG